MAKAKKEDECCSTGSCCTGMGKTCKSLTGLVLLVAGGAFVAGELGMLGSGALIGGALLALVGLSKILHSCGMCSMCGKA